MTDISIEVRNIDQVSAFIKSLPAGVKRTALAEVHEYIIGDQRHGLRHYAPYRYVSRQAAYGKSFFSDRQRKWFFWSLNTGRLHLPYSRTGELASGWQSLESDKRLRIMNSVPYAAHVMGDNTQSRHARRIGWRTASEVIRDNLRGAVRAADQAVQRWLNGR